jgi:hypothetical protein
VPSDASLAVLCGEAEGIARWCSTDAQDEFYELVRSILHDAEQRAEAALLQRRRQGARLRRSAALEDVRRSCPQCQRDGFLLLVTPRAGTGKLMLEYICTSCFHRWDIVKHLRPAESS